MTNVQSTTPRGWKVGNIGGRSLDVLSRQWISRPSDERFVTLDDLIDDCKARAERTQEIRVPNREIEVFSPSIEDGDDRDTKLKKTQQLMFGLPNGEEVAPTHWAFGQVAGLAKAPGGYLRTLPSPIVADALSYGLRYNRDKEDVKFYADDLEALAVTGPDYGRIYNWEVAEAVRMATASQNGDHRWKVPGRLDWSTMQYDPHAPVTNATTTIYGNDRGIFIFLVQDLAPIEIGRLPNGQPDYVFRGFYCKNSEVGAGVYALGAFYLRGICDNRILWGVEAFEELTMRHHKYAPARFIEEARPALESFANGSTQKLIDGVRKAKDAVIADTKEQAVEWLASRNVSRKRSMAIYDAIVKEEREGDESERPVTAWEMAQGITAVARNARNADDRMEQELDAKRILDKVA